MICKKYIYSRIRSYQKRTLHNDYRQILIVQNRLISIFVCCKKCNFNVMFFREFKPCVKISEIYFVGSTKNVFCNAPFGAIYFLGNLTLCCTRKLKSSHSFHDYKLEQYQNHYHFHNCKNEH